MKRKRYNVYKMFWTETEAGWGSRPDGYTVHLSKTDFNAYVKSYWARMPKEAPHEYSRPDGTEDHLMRTTKMMTTKEYKFLVLNRGMRR